jgi:hypothetical protein
VRTTRAELPPARPTAAGRAVPPAAGTAVPFYFEANAGQFDLDVQFSARRPGMDIYVTEAGANLALQPSGVATSGAGVRLRPIGASPSVPAVGLDPLPGRVNHLVNSDSQRWTTGVPTYATVAGDWDGRRGEDPGTFEAGVFKLRNSNSAGVPDVAFAFGDARGFAVAGDFDGDGTDDVGVVRNGLWQLRITGSGATSSFTFGSGSWPATILVVGDWDGDGIAGIGTYTYATGAWSLRNTPDAGAADQSFTYTAGAGSYPLIGDWDGDEVDSVGVKLGTTWSLRNAAGGGAAEVTFTFGLDNDLPVVWAGPVNPI